MHVGRYELVAKLGEGGTAEVYLARGRGAARVQKLVVVKRLRPERAAEPEARARFAEEARVAVSLAHPHIVPVFEFGESEGQLYLVMEWVRGGPLAAIAGPGRVALGWQACALVGAEICDALASVHGRRDRGGAALVHGDVTPVNILLTDEGHALLGDFGMARFAARGRGGTRRYLAPEQARGESFDGRADLYALALVLFESATATAGYVGEGAELDRHTRAGLVPVLDGVSPGLGQVLSRALAPSPAARFAGAAEMGRALGTLLDQEAGARSEGRREMAARLHVVREARGELAPTATATATHTAGRPKIEPPLWASRRARLGLAALAATLALVGGVAAWAKLAGAKLAVAPGVAAELPVPAVAVPPAATVPTVSSVPTPTVPLPKVAPVAPTSSTRHAAKTDSIVPVAMAHLDLNAVPWATVRIDGAASGETPLLAVALKPGRHTIELENPPLGIKRTVVLELGPGEHLRRIEDLAPRE